MNSTLRNILSVIIGWIVGSAINIGLINTGHKVIPIAGVDINDMQAMAAVMPTLEYQYFIFPFLGHALGTLVGATIAGLIAASYKMKFSMAIGLLFLLGGIAVNYLITGPIWFTILDIMGAYIPMAWIGGKIAIRLSGSK